jgi:hypothetical protein
MRALNRTAATVLGLLLLIIGLVAIAELVVAANHRTLWPRWLADWLNSWRTTTIGDNRVLAISIIVAAVGLLITLSQVRRWRPDRIPTGDADRGVWWLSRRAVEKRARASTQAVVGVHHAHADVLGGARTWRVRVRAEAPPERHEPVAQAVRDELRRLDLPAGVPVELALREPSRRVE